MQFKSCAIVLAALSLEGALAHPSAGAGHRHLHVRSEVAVEERQIGGSWDNKANYDGVNFSTVDYSGAPKPTAAPSAAEGVAPTQEFAVDAKAQAPPSNAASASSASSSSSSSSAAGAIMPLSGSNIGRTSFGGITPPGDPNETILYVGNVGSPYGSNMIQVDSIGSYKYTNTFQSTASTTRTIIIWNKVGIDGKPLGGQGAPPAMAFHLAPGATQVVAFDANSQGGWCDFTIGQRNSVGVPEAAWGEFNFLQGGNPGGWSSADVSQIQGKPCNMTISCNGQTSACGGHTGYVSDKQADGIGINLNEDTVHMQTTIGDY